MNELNERELYTVKRRKAHIRLREIAEYIKCSVSLLSRFETNSSGLSEEKFYGYKRYIDERL